MQTPMADDDLRMVSAEVQEVMELLVIMGNKVGPNICQKGLIRI